jgi:hypothetical protein
VIGVVLAIGLGLVIGFARRGSINNLGEAHLRGVPIVFAGVAFQVGSMLAERARLDWLPLALILTSFACVFIFAALNWRLSGMALAAGGALANFVVIAANGGMPVSLEAAARAGLGNPFADPSSVAKGAHHAMTEDSVLTFLADVIPLRIGSNVVSVGDILIWAGLLVIVQQLMVRPKGRRRHGTRQREAAAS